MHGTSYHKIRHGRKHLNDVEEKRRLWKDEGNASLVGISAAKPDLRMHTDTHAPIKTICRVKSHINYCNKTKADTFRTETTFLQLCSFLG